MKYRTRQTEVDAIQFTGSNFDECLKWSGNSPDRENVRVVERQGLPYALVCFGENGASKHVLPGAWMIRVLTGIDAMGGAAFERDYEPFYGDITAAQARLDASAELKPTTADLIEQEVKAARLRDLEEQAYPLLENPDIDTVSITKPTGTALPKKARRPAAKKSDPTS